MDTAYRVLQAMQLETLEGMGDFMRGIDDVAAVSFLTTPPLFTLTDSKFVAVSERHQRGNCSGAQAKQLEHPASSASRIAFGVPQYFSSEWRAYRLVGRALGFGKCNQTTNLASISSFSRRPAHRQRAMWRFCGMYTA